ncbi:nadh:ubiquinone oxidoreductase subunit [Lasallia pustulata]|uniref:Nadh:ubiquinone oxidoreductase subunit n=1 Tax=Lasallia pustulata TaxID=136370 RepID=A0A1W5D177_9LECA|nr:nadh:ubiquinone oxidoreductase subunit [Lasallia pustulata]
MQAMLPRRLAAARPLTHSLRAPIPRPFRTQLRYVSQADIDDPNMNGGYINPIPEKRQFRDPYGDWWDKQERRNYGEPVHEDNDILGMFSPEEYTHFTPGKSFFLLGCFVATVGVLLGVVSVYYPDKPSAPRTFPGGLEAELGGPNAVPARKHEGDV